MTDLSKLSNHSTFRPPPGGVEAAREAGARYRSRRRMVQGGSGATAAAVAVGALVLYGASGNQRDALVPADLAPAPQVTIHLDPESPPPTPAVGGGTPRNPEGGSRGSGVAAVPAAPSSPIHSAPSSAARPPQPAPAQGPYSRVDRAYVHDAAPEVCAGQIIVAGEPVGESCSGATVSGTGRSRTLGIHVCQSRGSQQPTTLFFETAREVDWRIFAQGGGVPWTWGGDAEPTGDEHTVTVDPGDCLTWRTTWTLVDDDGDPVPVGTYTLRASLLLISGERSYERSFQV